MEYDAVIALGVNETFSNTPFNQRLLYIAISRAKHYLALHWSGKQSPILAGAQAALRELGVEAGRAGEDAPQAQ